MQHTTAAHSHAALRHGLCCFLSAGHWAAPPQPAFRQKTQTHQDVLIESKYRNPREGTEATFILVIIAVGEVMGPIGMAMMLHGTVDRASH